MQQGDAFRGRRDWDKAKRAYEEALKSFGAANNGRMQTAARQMLDVSTAMPTLNLTKMKDGAYQGTDSGYVTDITVEVTVKGGRISLFRIVSHRENRALKSLENVPQQIVSRRTPSVDVTSGATITSAAVMSATVRALRQAQPATATDTKGKGGD